MVTTIHFTHFSSESATTNILIFFTGLEHGLNTVALSGGVFQNRLLLTRTLDWLTELGFEAYTNQRVPPNDGGLALGQAAIAAARLAKE